MNYLNDQDIIILLQEINKNKSNIQSSKQDLKIEKLYKKQNFQKNNDWSIDETIYLFRELIRHKYKFKQVHQNYQYGLRTIDELKNRYNHVRDQLSTNIDFQIDSEHYIKEEEVTKIEHFEIKIKQEEAIPYLLELDKDEIPFSNRYEVTEEQLKNIYQTFLVNQMQLQNIQNHVVFLRKNWINKSFPLPNKHIDKLIETNLTKKYDIFIYSQGCQNIMFEYKYAMLDCLREMTITKNLELLKEELKEKQNKLLWVQQGQ